MVCSLFLIKKKAHNVRRGLFICSCGVQLTSSKRIRERACDHEDPQAIATPKDGPTDGIDIYTTLVSRMTKTPVSQNVAMTGEIKI